MFEKYTEKARRTVFFARHEAAQLGSPYIESEHLLLGLLHENKALANQFLRSHAAAESIRKQIEGHSTSKEKGSASVDLPLSHESKRVLAFAAEEAERLSHKHIGAGHMLLGLLREEKCFAAEMLHERGLRLSLVREEVGRIESAQPAPNQLKETSILSKVARDLGQAATEGQLHPLVDRENEVNRVIQILCRRSNNNAVLIGDPDVARSSVMECLARDIAEGDVPSFLADKRLFAIDLSRLESESNGPAQFKDRLRSLMKEMAEAQNIILFIEELFTLVTPVSADGWLDVATILRPSLLRGAIQCIAATTPSGYNKSIEKHSFLITCFEVVRIPSLTEAECRTTLGGLKDRYEKFHCVVFDDDALAFAIELAQQDLPERSFLDKVMDLLDEAGADVKLRQTTPPAELADVQKRIRFIVHRMENAISNHEFEKARFYSDEERKERENLRQIKEKHHIDDTAVGRVRRNDIEGAWVALRDLARKSVNAVAASERPETNS